MNPRRMRPLGAVLIVTALALTPSFSLLAVDSSGLFELGDGFGTTGSADIAGSDTQDGCDWAQLFDADPTPAEIAAAVDACGGLTATFLADSLSQGKFKDATVFSGGSSKNDSPIADWRWDTGNVTSKGDVSNFYTYATLNESNDLLVFAGLERIDNSGSVHVDFELNQATLGLDKEPPCGDDGTAGPDDGAPCEFTGEKVVGDVLVSMDFLQGGSLGVVEIRRWDGSSYVVVETLPGEGCNEADTICAFNNGGDIDGGPWPNYDAKGKEVATIPVNGFTEAGINITQILGATPCFNTVQAKTRSSASYNSSLQDFGLASFGVCSLDVDKTVAGPSGLPLAQPGDMVTYTVTVENTGAGDLYLIDMDDTLLGNLTETALSEGCGTVRTGEFCTFDIVTAVPDDSQDPIDSRITATYSGTAGPNVSAVSDTAVTILDIFLASVDVSLSADSLAVPGQSVDYTVRVANTSTLNSPDLVGGSIQDTLLGDLLDPFNAFVTGSDCSGELATGSLCTITARRTVLASDPDPLASTVTASYVPAGGFSNVVSDSATFQVDLAHPAFQISVVPSPDSGLPGDLITYAYTLTNSGDIPLTRISVTDSLLGDVSSSLPAEVAPGETVMVELQRAIQPDDPDPLVSQVTAVYQVLGLSETVTVTVSVDVQVQTACALSPGFWGGGNGVSKWDQASDPIAAAAGFTTGTLFPWLDPSLAGTTYLGILNLPAGGDVTRQLSFKYVAARLNQATFGVPAGTALLLDRIDAYLASHPVGSDPNGRARNDGQALLSDLNAYYVTVGEQDCPSPDQF